MPEIENILEEFYNSKVFSFKSKHYFEIDCQDITLNIPDKLNCKYLEIDWSISSCLSNLNLKTFTFILVLILMEKSIVFLSKNLRLLSSTMFFFF